MNIESVDLFSFVPLNRCLRIYFVSFFFFIFVHFFLFHLFCKLFDFSHSQSLVVAATFFLFCLFLLLLFFYALLCVFRCFFYCCVVGSSLCLIFSLYIHFHSIYAQHNYKMNLFITEAKKCLKKIFFFVIISWLLSIWDLSFRTLCFGISFAKIVLYIACCLLPFAFCTVLICVPYDRMVNHTCLCVVHRFNAEIQIWKWQNKAK